MIYLNNNSLNSLYLGLDKPTGTTYIFKIEDETSLSSVTFYCQQITGTTDYRFQKFYLTLSSSTAVNLTGGTIYLKNKNDYNLYYGYKTGSTLSWSNIIDYKMYKVKINFGDETTTNNNDVSVVKNVNNIIINKQYK